MIKYFLTFTCICLGLSGCTWLAPDIQEPVAPLVESGSVVHENRELEQFPSTVSLEYFSQMRLEGTDFTLGDLLASNDAYKRYSITYSSNGLKISGILDIPNGEGPFPLMVMNHGYIDRSVYTNGRGLKREQDFFARQGYAVLHSDYRGHAFSDPSPLPDDTSIYDAGIEYSMDVINGISALKAANIPYIDTDTVFMLGHSLGGGVSLNIAVTYPDLIDGLILYAPVHSDAYENFSRWRDMRLEVDDIEKVIGSRESDYEFWDKISSSVLLSQITMPIILFHGTADADVPKEWSDTLAETLRDLGKDITYIVYDEEKHEFIAQWEDFMRKTVQFTEGIRSNGLTSSSFYVTDRITKKPFGVYISPGNSPVSPERFAGYHVGTDFELYEDEDPHNISVTSLCSGTVQYVAWVKGYGGVLVQSCTVEGAEVTVLYGHLALDTIAYRAGDSLPEGERIATLGKGYSMETDNERPHLHLAVHKGTSVELRGYAEEKNEISDWMDPRVVFNL